MIQESSLIRHVQGYQDQGYQANVFQMMDQCYINGHLKTFN